MKCSLGSFKIKAFTKLSLYTLLHIRYDVAKFTDSNSGIGYLCGIVDFTFVLGLDLRPIWIIFRF